MPLPVITTVPQRIQEQWLFTDAELEATPAILQGMPLADERARRAKGVNFITQAGIMLKLPQVTLGTASMFLHRIFMRVGMDESKGGIHHYNIAATALFLATKSEENCRKTKDIVIAVAKVAGKNPQLIIDEQSKEFWRWKDSILLYEEMMLELLTFDVVLDSPYTHLYHLLRRLNLEERKELRNVAWAFVNDSQLTTLGLMIPAKDVAIGAIFFAARWTKNTIEDAEDGRPWWDVVEGNEDHVVKAVTVLHDFYTDNPLKRADSPHEGTPPKNAEDLNITRARRAGGSDESGDATADGKSHAKEHSDESMMSSTIKGGDTAPRTEHCRDGEAGQPYSWDAHGKEPSDESNPAGYRTARAHGKEPSDESNAAGYRTALAHGKENSDSSTQPSAKVDGWNHTEAEEGEVRGDSDDKLKEAANDPATHQGQSGTRNRGGNENDAVGNSVASGVGDLHIAQQASHLAPPTNGGSGSASVKRKAEDEGDAVGEDAKRPRTGGSEEGELQ